MGVPTSPSCPGGSSAGASSASPGGPSAGGSTGAAGPSAGGAAGPSTWANAREGKLSKTAIRIRMSVPVEADLQGARGDVGVLLVAAEREAQAEVDRVAPALEEI